MSDINKFIGTDPDQMDANERLQDLEQWSEDIARQLAAADNVDMTDAHWEVIHFLRHHYIDHGPVQRARDLTAALDERFEAQGGKRYLYGLFPDGPVRQGCRIAGLPVPADSANTSFGSVQ